MAPVNTRKGTQLLIKISDEATVPTFEHPCLINTQRGIQWASTGQDEEIPDCDDPDAIAWTKHTKTGATGTVTGTGKLDADSVEFWWDWFNSDDAKPLQVEIEDVGTWEGDWKVTEFSVTGDRGTKMEASVTLKSDGIQVYTPVP